jgi:hypothetical protein
MAFLARAIPAKPFRTAALRAYMASALRQSRQDVLKDLESTVNTWNHTVNFTVRIYYRGANAELLAYTGDYVWNILNTGTLRKFAHVSSDFRPKTRVRRIPAMAGAGTVYPSKTPTKGIDARQWTAVIFEKNEKVFNQRIVAAIYNGLR